MTHPMSVDIGSESLPQAVDHLLVPHPGSRRHEQLPVDGLVAVAVVGERPDHVGGVVSGGGHAHKVAAVGKGKQ